MGSSRLSAGRSGLFLLWVSRWCELKGGDWLLPGFMWNLMPHQMELSRFPFPLHMVTNVSAVSGGRALPFPSSGP